MATTVARLEAVLSAKTRDFDRAMGQSESKIHKVAKTAAFAAGAAGIGAIAYTLKAGISEWKQQQIVAAQTNAVLKSTRHGAHLTAKEISDLATSLMKKSGIDDEAIQSGENLLLTFRNIRDEVGKGNDIFTRASKASLDLAVAFHKGPEQAAILVGKALNDPIKGLTALQRVGVTFTKAQKDQIKALVDSGHTVQAQKIILGELTKETGGSAEAIGKTLPGMINIARETFNNWAGDLVTKMIPVLQQIVAWVRVHWPEISAAFQQAWANIKPTLVALKDLVVSVVATIREHWGTIGPIVRQAATVIRDMLRVITDVIRVFSAVLRGDWSEAWRLIKKTVFDAFELIKDRIILQKDIIVALVRGVGTAIWDGFKAALNAGWKAVKGVISDLFGKVIGWVKDVLGIHSPSSVFHEIGVNVVKGFASGIGAAGGILKSAVVGMVKSLPGAIGGIIGKSPGPSNFGGIVGVGKWLQSRGFDVSEHPAFGGVHPVHVKGSYHYKNRAIDVNWPGGGSVELNHLQAAFGAIKPLRPIEEMIEDIGSSNQHLHVAFAKGGIVTKPTRALIGEAGPEAVVPLSGLSTGGSWQSRYYNFMQRVWQFARPYFPNATGPMPPVQFTQGLDSLFVGTDFTPDAHGNIPPPGKRMLYWPKWLSFFANRNKALSAYETLIHEWAHQFQDVKQTQGIRLGEGGAEAFAEAYTPAIYRGLGFHIKPSEVKGIMGNYYGYVKWVLANKGMNWVNKGQFGVFDNGGWLQPGLTMAYNGTGQPERVGGGGNVNNFYFPNYHGDEKQLMDLMRRASKLFENRNGRPAFGGA